LLELHLSVACFSRKTLWLYSNQPQQQWVPIFKSTNDEEDEDDSNQKAIVGMYDIDQSHKLVKENKSFL
jgi:hypothetical protein